MKQFTDTEGLFHVYVVPVIPEGSGESARREKATSCPVDWDRACVWVNSIMTGIGLQGREWFTDCDIEPAECPRPWTQEVRSAFDREHLRCNVEAGLRRERDCVGRLHADLSNIRGAKFADFVRDGAA